MEHSLLTLRKGFAIRKTFEVLSCIEVISEYENIIFRCFTPFRFASSIVFRIVGEIHGNLVVFAISLCSITNRLRIFIQLRCEKNLNLNFLHADNAFTNNCFQVIHFYVEILSRHVSCSICLVSLTLAITCCNGFSLSTINGHFDRINFYKVKTC